jgi:PAS domain S-box-containing protein
MTKKPTYEELEQRIKELEKEAVEHKRSKEELQTILNVVPVMIFQKDRDGKTIRTNQAFDNMIGLSKEQIIGKTTDELFPAHGKDMIKDDQKVMELGKPKLDIIEHYDSPEETRWARTGKAPLKDKEGNVVGLIGYAADITEQKQAEEALKQERDKLQDALAKVKILSGLLPICANCKKIRDDKGYWNQIEAYIRDHSEADFSHSICPECAKKFYPEFHKGD